MVRKQNEKLVQAFFDSSNQGDLDTSLSLLSEDLVWTSVGTHSFSGIYKGKQNLIDNLLGRLFSKLKQGIHTEIERIIAEGDQVAVVASGKAETVSGVPYNNHYCFLFTILNGKITSVLEFCDTALVEKVLGD